MINVLKNAQIIFEIQLSLIYILNVKQSFKQNQNISPILILKSQVSFLESEICDRVYGPVRGPVHGPVHGPWSGQRSVDRSELRCSTRKSIRFR